MKNQKALIYGALGVIALGVLVYILKPKEDGEEESKDTTSPETKDGVSEEQKTPDPKIEKQKDASGKLTSLIGKEVYTKIADVHIRDSAMVNNGIINNIYGVLPSKDILIGKVTANVKKGDYNWLGVKLSQKAYDIIQSEKSIITRDIWVNIPPLKWVREDVVKLK